MTMRRHTLVRYVPRTRRVSRDEILRRQRREEAEEKRQTEVRRRQRENLRQRLIDEGLLKPNS